MPPRPTEPEAFQFADDGFVPNNARLPYLVYRGVMLPDADPVFGKQGPLLRHWGN